MNTARFFTALLLVLSMGMSAYAQEEAAADAPAAAEESAPEKVDTGDLEKKYWAPSDQGYTVVQDRTYSKSGKFGVSVFAGPVLMYDWYDGFDFGVAGSYQFNDRWSLEVQFQSFSLDDIDAVGQVDGLGGAVNRGEIKSYYGVTGRWTPFYSKMSFLGSKIVYFDMSFGLNLGLVNYDQKIISGDDSQSSVAFGFDISQNYFITPWLALRVDYTMKFFNEEVVNFNPASPGEEEDKLSSFSTFNLGLTYLF